MTQVIVSSKRRRPMNKQQIKGYTDDGKIIFEWNEKGQPVCHSPLPRRQHRPETSWDTGRFCRRTDTCDNGRCLLHGGHAASGLMHGSYSSGKFTSIGGALRAKYMNLAQDEKLMELRPELAMALTVEEQVLKRAEAGLSKDFVVMLLELMAEALQHVDAVDAMQPRVKDYATLADFVKQLYMLLAGERDTKGALEEYIAIGEHARKLNETEQRRVERLGGLIRIDAVLAAFGGVETLAQETITIAADRERFGAGLAKLLSQGHGGEATAIRETAKGLGSRDPVQSIHGGR